MLKIINKSVRLKTMILNFINIFHYLIDFFKLSILKLSNLINRDKFFNHELIILTGCDFTFYDSFVQLIKSIRQYEKSIKIIFYDLGLSDIQATELKNNYPLIEYKKFNFKKYPSFFSQRDSFNKLGSYAWKSAIILQEIKSNKSNLIWLDTGNIITKNLNNVRIVLNFSGFLSPLSNGTIEQWTHNKTLEYMSVSNKILNKRNLTGGIIGVNPNDEKSLNLIEEWQYFSAIEECISPLGSSRKNHRQDQSLLSILFYKKQNKFIHLKSKDIFNIKVNQNPGKKVYVSESYGHKNLESFRDNWYSNNNNISTNTISVADTIWIISPKNINKIPKKYLKKCKVILSFIDSSKFDEKQTLSLLKQFDKYIDLYTLDKKSFEHIDKFKNINKILDTSHKKFDGNYLKVIKKYL